MNKHLYFQEIFVDYLQKYSMPTEPSGLYEPINYILNLKGKRLRPLMTLMITECFNGDYKKALHAALSIEMFHNFSLVHDDIMDSAPLRRGQLAVHKKWDVNTGILSGDAMLILAYQLFESYDAKIFQSLAKLFNHTALKVCEGQQYDVDFETRENVTIPEYLKMIEYKTAVLVAASMAMGAIVANASQINQNLIYNFGLNLGLAFQLQDDYLDAFGTPNKVGKQLGGDIIENKKTFLYLKAIELGTEVEKHQLQQLFASKEGANNSKIKAVIQIFKSSGAALANQEKISFFTKKAFDILNDISISEDNKSMLKEFGTELMNRTA